MYLKFFSKEHAQHYYGKDWQFIIDNCRVKHFILKKPYRHGDRIITETCTVRNGKKRMFFFSPEDAQNFFGNLWQHLLDSGAAKIYKRKKPTLLKGVEVKELYLIQKKKSFNINIKNYNYGA